MKAVRHIFFDLDNTLWDFGGNSAEVLSELYRSFGLGKLGIPSAQAFVERYEVHNEMAWKAYREGRMDHEQLRWERYWRTLGDFGHQDRKLAIELSVSYLDHLARKDRLMPGAREALSLVQGRYDLHIITNGFEEVQRRKLRSSRLAPYFRSVTTAEAAGMAKPDPRIFSKALIQANADPSQSLYIGDHLVIDGSASEAGMHFLWYNPSGRAENSPHRQIGHWAELAGVLNA